MDRHALTADIDTGEDGPHVGAFFDFDGTVISGYSGMALAQDRLKRRDMSPAEVLRTASTSIAFARNRATFADLALIMAQSFRGRPIEDLDELGERLFVQQLANRIYPEARELVAAHHRKGHTVVMATSATHFQVQPLARELGVDHILSTRLETVDGLVTGRLDGLDLWGEGKQRAVEAFAADKGIDLHCSYAYADGNEDVALLGIVGNPRPTNPAKKLAQAAADRNWPVQRFEERGRPGVGTVVRSVAAYGTFLGSAVVGGALAKLNGSKSVGMNVFSSVGPELAFALAGVRVNVDGENNLWKRRPAIFIFNHQSGLDAMLMIKLVRRDYAGAGKKELQSNPLFKLIGSLVDVVYLDRQNSAAAVGELERLMKQTAAEGKSIIISPEGTRSTGARVGMFKKGPFRMAMAGGLPIVPIVIRNALDSQPRKSLTMRTADIDVAVLDPIETEGWQPEQLAENIAAVRQLYIDRLADWSSGR